MDSSLAFFLNGVDILPLLESSFGGFFSLLLSSFYAISAKFDFFSGAPDDKRKKTSVRGPGLIQDRLLGFYFPDTRHLSSRLAPITMTDSDPAQPQQKRGPTTSVVTLRADWIDFLTATDSRCNFSGHTL